MRCVFCKIGGTRPRRVAVTSYNEAADVVALVHNLPAEVCDYCGEEYYQATDWEKVEELLAKEPPVRITPILVYTLGT